MSNKIRLGILGGGGDSLIGILHRVASTMYDKYQLIGGAFNPVLERSIEFAQAIGIPTDRVYQDIDTLIAEELKLPVNQRMQVISILTPNFLHFPMAKKLLENGFHVICEKANDHDLRGSQNFTKNLIVNQVCLCSNLYLYGVSYGATNAQNDRPRCHRKGAEN